MKNPVENNKVLKFGTTTFNSLALKGMTKDEFLKLYKGKLHVDVNEVWKKVKKYTKK
jgi:hypothetical protein